MRPSSFSAVAITGLAGVSLASVSTPSVAETIEEFYRGKQIKIYIRATPGGNYDVYSRVLGRYMMKHIPGNPSYVPINMPGGGGLVALNYVANVAPRDGTTLTMITQSFPMDQALGLEKNLKIDMRSLNWIGSMSNTNEFIFTLKSSPTKTLADARARETTVAATGIGSITAQLSAVYNNILGTRFKVIYGYPSGPEMTLAMERSEVEGRSTSNPQVLAPTKAEVAAKFNMLIQTGTRKFPGYEEVPLLTDLVKDPEQQAIVQFISKAVVIARPIVTNPGVPADRVTALRRAFDATLLDREFLEDAERQSLEIGARSGEELEKLVNDLIGTPKEILAKIAQAMTVRDAAAIPGAKSGSE